jgi:hypothetical protein
MNTERPDLPAGRQGALVFGIYEELRERLPRVTIANNKQPRLAGREESTHS